MIYRLVSDIKQIYFTQSNMSAKITNAVNALVLAEKKAQIDEIKAYLSEKMSDADEVCELLSEFASSIEITKVVKTKKKAASDKPKKPRKKSYYHHWLSQRLKSYAEEHKGENDKSERMTAIGLEWAAIKQEDDFEEKKAAWEEKSANETSDAEKKIEKEPKKKTGKKVSKVIPVENVSDDDSDDDNDNTKAVVAPIESEDDDSDSDSD